MKRFYLAIVITIAMGLGTLSAPKASAQEILLEGPLAGAPAVRKMVEYRNRRFSLGPQVGYVMVPEYMHNIMIGARAEYNIFDWLSVGAVGYYVFNTPTNLTDHISTSTDVGGQATTPSESNFPSYTGAENFENQVAELNGMYLGQVAFTPLRGKMALFERLFVAVDGSIFVGGGIVQYEQRQNCTGIECGTLDDPTSWNLGRETRFKGAFTWGLGLMTYFNDYMALNIEYRMTPFKWNAGGTDEAGTIGSVWEEPESSADGWNYRQLNREGGFPDGNLDDNDMKWNLNQSISVGFIVYFPFQSSVRD